MGERLKLQETVVLETERRILKMQVPNANLAGVVDRPLRHAEPHEGWGIWTKVIQQMYSEMRY